MDYGGKHCYDSGCHGAGSSAALDDRCRPRSDAAAPNPLPIPLPTDWVANYTQATQRDELLRRRPTAICSSIPEGIQVPRRRQLIDADSQPRGHAEAPRDVGHALHDRATSARCGSVASCWRPSLLAASPARADDTRARARDRRGGAGPHRARVRLPRRLHAPSSTRCSRPSAAPRTTTGSASSSPTAPTAGSWATRSSRSTSTRPRRTRARRSGSGWGPRSSRRRRCRGDVGFTFSAGVLGGDGMFLFRPSWLLAPHVSLEAMHRRDGRQPGRRHLRGRRLQRLPVRLVAGDAVRGRRGRRRVRPQEGRPVHDPDRQLLDVQRRRRPHRRAQEAAHAARRRPPVRHLRRQPHPTNPGVLRCTLRLLLIASKRIVAPPAGAGRRRGRRARQQRLRGLEVDRPAAPARAPGRSDHVARRHRAGAGRRAAHPREPRRGRRRERDRGRRVRLQLRRRRAPDLDRGAALAGLGAGARADDPTEAVGAPDVLPRAVDRRTTGDHRRSTRRSTSRRRSAAASASRPAGRPTRSAARRPAVFGPHAASTRSPAPPSSTTSASRSTAASPTTARTPASAPPTPTAGSTTTARTRSRSPRATISTTTTSRSALSYTPQLGQRLRRQQRRGETPLRPAARSTSSAHCFKPAHADVVTQPLPIDAVEPSLSWTMTPAPGRPGGRHHPDPRRVPVEPLPQRAGRQPAPRRRRSTSRPYRQRYAVFARAAYAFPQWRASGIGDGAPLRGQLGGAGGDRRPGGQQVPQLGDAVDPARPLPPPERRQLLSRRPGIPRPRPGRAVLDRRPRALADEQLPGRRPDGLPAPPPAGARRPGSPRWRPT